MKDITLVFLDVDGILTYSKYRNKETCNIDPDKIKLLKKLCDDTDASVVITSSWRGSNKWTPKCYYVLRNILQEANIPVLGDTPYIPSRFLEPQTRKYTITLDELQNLRLEFGTGRAAEVQAYLKEHPTKSFVILDDEDYDWAAYGYHTHWVRPSWFCEALTEQYVKEAYTILKG